MDQNAVFCINSYPSTSWWKEHSFPILNGLGSLVKKKSADHRLEVFLNFQFHSTKLYVQPYTSIHYLDYRSSVVTFELGSMNSPTLCFLKCVLLFWVPWISIWIVGSACPFLQISQLSFWQAALNLVDQFGEYCHLKNIKYSNLWQWTTLHLFRSSLISFDHCTLFVALSVESILSP